MELPTALLGALRALGEGYPLPRLSETSREITRKYKTESGRGARLVTTELEAAVYALVRMPATYCAVSTALRHTLECFPEPLRSMTDIGAGTGAGAWAAHGLCEELRSVTCLEQEPAMIRLGAKLADGAMDGLQWIQRDFNAPEAIPHADLVLASYALNEARDDQRKLLISRLWDASSRLLLLVEPGTPEGFRQLRSARETLRSLGAHIAAPCPGDMTCPMEGENWCHFTCRVPRTKLHRLIKGGEAPYEDEKFAYLAAAKAPAAPVAGRILRHPTVEPGKITLRLCTAGGETTEIVTKKQGPAFKQARKSASGDGFAL